MAIGATIRIAICPSDGRNPDVLFNHADLARCRGDAAGRNTYRFYEPGMDALVATRNLLEPDTRDAIARGVFKLRYQPVVDRKLGRIAGFEAPMRRDHPVREPIAPGEFILLAEETGLTVPRGARVLRAAYRRQRRVPGALRFALDDFGIGYSSLSCLRRVPFDKIKIDRSVIREIADPDTAAIVRAVIGIGERLGTSITAEGVEMQAQHDPVTEEGCTEARGCLVGRPAPVRDLPALLVRFGSARPTEPDADRPARVRAAPVKTLRRRAAVRPEA